MVYKVILLHHRLLVSLFVYNNMLHCGLNIAELPGVFRSLFTLYCRKFCWNLKACEICLTLFYSVWHDHVQGHMEVTCGLHVIGIGLS